MVGYDKNGVWIAPVSVSVVIPVYNEKGRLENVLGKLGGYQDIIVIDDGSEIPVNSYLDPDAYKGVRFLQNGTNRGYLYSVKRGIATARGDIIVTMDADGEHKPEDIDKLIAPIKEGTCDIVYGKRPNIARFSERILLKTANVFTGEKLQDAGTGFRAIRASFAKQLSFSGKCTCGLLHLECFQKGMRSCEIAVDLPVVDKPRRVAWEHLPQFFIVVKTYIQYRLFGVKA